MSLFGSSGIRRVADRELLEQALRTGISVGKTRRSVIVSTDTRTSRDAVKYALISGLLSSGCKAYDADILPTPTLAYAARNFDSGVVITASHNPPEYNGIKLWNPDGSAFNSAQREQVEQDIYNDSLVVSSWNKMQCIESYNGAIEEHMERILGDFHPVSNVSVVVDCGCGAASLITPHLLKQMGCKVLNINSYPCISQSRPSEPTAENLVELSRVVKTMRANLGIAHDGDADRMMAIDDEGRFITGDKLMALFCQELKPKKLVTTIDASMAIDELGIEVVRTRVGDTFVSEELKGGGDFGGEASGSWIFPKVSFCPDGIYAAAKLVQMVEQKKLSRMVDNLSSYYMLRDAIPIDRELMGKIEEKLTTLNPLSVSTIDGIRLSFNNGWVLVRPSGTEPKVRITVETKSAERTEMFYNTIVALIAACKKSRSRDIGTEI
ncbi:MAG: phosphoglucosamine mutase [Dehalococcoidia bacterium]|nr:phosphoglucosamine mutase [Dehalococcoidia bacterium]